MKTLLTISKTKIKNYIVKMLDIPKGNVFNVISMFFINTILNIKSKIYLHTFKCISHFYILFFTVDSFNPIIFTQKPANYCWRKGRDWIL